MDSTLRNIEKYYLENKQPKELIKNIENFDNKQLRDVVK